MLRAPCWPPRVVVGHHREFAARQSCEGRLRNTGLICGLCVPAILAGCSGPVSDSANLNAGSASALGSAADWPMYHRDYAGTRYSPLDQIGTDNVTALEPAWVYRYNRADRPRITGPSLFEIFQQVTPIVVDGILYLPAGDRVVALEPETGEEIWVHELDSGLASFRGVAYWPGTDDVAARIYFTSLKRLIALNAADGSPARDFGVDGTLELGVAYSGVPTIYRDHIIIGANFFGPGETHIGPQLREPRGQSGDSRAYDAITGEKLWEYHTIPRPGEPGNETWGDDSWQNRTGNNVWTFGLTVDTDYDLVYMPVSGPGANFYGGDRPGNNEPANSTVALDVMTGEVRWYFQNIHHELWDYNLPPAAALVDITVDGKTVPALAQTGKSAQMFILNRLTGEPVFGVNEVPVAAGDVPGEWYSPTQPIPVRPPPVARVSFDPAIDIVTADDTTPAHAAACRALYDEVGFYNAGPYTPLRLKAPGTPPSIVFPSLSGAVNWGGVAVDPERKLIFVNSKDEALTGWMVPNPAYSDATADTQVPYVRESGPLFEAPSGADETVSWPCFKPPWASLMAIDAESGEIVWSVPLGINETLPAGKQNVGSTGYGGPMVTAGGLVFIGATGDQRFRAFDASNGRELWSYRLPYTITANPMTFAGRDGRQYVAITAARSGDSPPGDEGLYVFALPASSLAAD
jgi:quinoprotein glucose dehydrogenase